MAFLVSYQSISHGDGLSPMWLGGVAAALGGGVEAPGGKNKFLEENKCQ